MTPKPNLRILGPEMDDLRDHLTRISGTFEQDAQLMRDAGDAVGHAKLKGVLKGFSDEWSIKRGKMLEGIKGLGTMVGDLIQGWDEADKQLAGDGGSLADARTTGATGGTGAGVAGYATGSGSSSADWGDYSKLGGQRIGGLASETIRGAVQDTAQWREDFAAHGGNTSFTADPVDWAYVQQLIAQWYAMARQWDHFDGPVSLPPIWSVIGPIISATWPAPLPDPTAPVPPQLVELFDKLNGNPPTVTNGDTIDAIGSIWQRIQDERKAALEASLTEADPAVAVDARTAAERIEQELADLGLAGDVEVRADPLDPNDIVAILKGEDGSTITVKFDDGVDPAVSVGDVNGGLPDIPQDIGGAPAEAGLPPDTLTPDMATGTPDSGAMPPIAEKSPFEDALAAPISDAGLSSGSQGGGSLGSDSLAALSEPVSADIDNATSGAWGGTDLLTSLSAPTSTGPIAGGNGSSGDGAAAATMGVASMGVMGGMRSMGGSATSGSGSYESSHPRSRRKKKDADGATSSQVGEDER